MKKAINEIKVINIKGRKFHICKDNEYIIAVEDKFLDGAVLNSPLSGNQLYTSKSVEECETLVKNACRVDELVEQGMTRMEAVLFVTDFPEEYNGEELTLDIIKRDTVWIAKLSWGRLTGSYERMRKAYEADEDARDLDVAAKQPEHLQAFYDAYFDAFKEHGWMSVDEFFNGYWTKEV